MHGSGHLAYVNSKALEICNIHADTPIPAGGQGEIHLGADGLPSGLLIGQAYNLALSVIPKYTVEEYKGAFRKGIAAANAKGVQHRGRLHRLHGQPVAAPPGFS